MVYNRSQKTMSMNKVKLLLLISMLSIVTLEAQQLGRRATWEAQIAWPSSGNPGALINSIEKGSPLTRAGLREGDRILEVDGMPVITAEDWDHINYGIRANRSTTIKVKRGSTAESFEVNLNALEKETHPGIDTYYEEVISDYGLAQRTIITKPKGKGKSPAIFLVQGLSCSTIEKFSSRSNNWVKLINDLAEKSGMVLMRVDKPGVGDSEGNCNSVDFHTELSGYEAALKELKNKPYVDTTNIIVYGNSMGSAIAPYLANKYNLKGVISDGTFYKTWYEHMLEIERRILGIEGDSPAVINQKMNEAYIPIYHGMLVGKKSFEEILEETPALAKYHRQGLQHMYGRPMAYYHQVQDFNFAGEWARVKVPVRVRWGTNDWIMSEFDNDMIMRVLDEAGHQDHELYKYPGLDHWSTIHPGYKESFTFQPGKWEDKISQQIIDWARYMVEKK